MLVYSATLLAASVLAAAAPEAAPAPAQPAPAGPAVAPAPGTPLTDPSAVWSAGPGCCDGEAPRGFLQSDRAFPRFIGPISNPILSKDPRSLTELRPLYIYNKIDPANPLGSGNFDVYAAEIRLALTDRLTLIADKDGYATIHPRTGGTLEGWLNLNAGLKYTLVRDVENQFLVTVGTMYEVPSGEGAVFQDQGSGIWTFFATAGKEFNEKTHVLNTFGYQVPTKSNANSSFIYDSLHLDYQLLPRLYPLVEFNWFHYTAGGDRGIPAIIGEGDGLINIGTSGVAGNDLVTGAVGLKAIISQHMEAGAAWEVPLSNRHDLLNNRVTVELIFRY